jgi:uncharacterized protein (TIGR00251 family)
LELRHAVLTVRVTPRSGRDEIAGWRDGALLVRIKAPPVEGKANDALRRLLAAALGVALRDVVIAGSAASRTKRVRIAGLTEEDVRSKFGPGS